MILVGSNLLFLEEEEAEAGGQGGGEAGSPSILIFFSNESLCY